MYISGLPVSNTLPFFLCYTFTSHRFPRGIHNIRYLKMKFMSCPVKKSETQRSRWNHEPRRRWFASTRLLVYFWRKKFVLVYEISVSLRYGIINYFHDRLVLINTNLPRYWQKKKKKTHKYCTCLEGFEALYSSAKGRRTAAHLGRHDFRGVGGGLTIMSL